MAGWVDSQTDIGNGSGADRRNAVTQCRRAQMKMIHATE